MREHLLRQAADIARSTSPALVRRLTFSAADKGSPAFEDLREQMIASGRHIMRLYGSETTYLGIYSMALRGGTLVERQPSFQGCRVPKILHARKQRGHGTRK